MISHGRRKAMATDLFEILHEDEDLLVINKPAGLVCHPTKGDERSSLALAAVVSWGGGASAPDQSAGPQTSGVQGDKTERPRASCGSYGRAVWWRSSTGRPCTGTWPTRKE